MPRRAYRTTKTSWIITYICLGLAIIIVATLLFWRSKSSSGADTSVLAVSSTAAAATKEPQSAQTAVQADPAQTTQTAAPKPTASAAVKTPQAVVDVSASPAPLPLSAYTAVLNADPDSAHVNARLNLKYVNNTGVTLYELVLRLWPNALKKDCVQIQSLTQDGIAADYGVGRANGDPTVLTVALSRDLKPGSSVNIGIAYTLDVPEAEDRFGVNELGMNLGNAIPTMSVYENGAWRTDPYEHMGDSFYSEAAEYTVVIRCPLSYGVAASGTASVGRYIEAENIYEGLYTAKAARDFSVAFVKGAFVEAAQSDNGVRVLSYTKQRKKSEALAQSAASALSYFEKKLGAYPYDDFCAVATKITGGMEYPGMVLINYDDLDGSTIPMGELYLAHEIAHQWFYNLVGSDQSKTPWVDEALVEFLSFDYIRTLHGQEYMEQLWSSRFHDIQGQVIGPRMDAALADFAKASMNDYVYGVYARGSAMYEEIYQKMGDEAFYAALNALCEEKRFGVVTGDELIARFSKAAGEDLAPVFEKYMSMQPAAAQSEAIWE